MHQRIPPPPGGFAGLLGRVVIAIVTIAVLIASFFVGAVVAIALAGFAVLAWAAFAVRWWWLKRRMRKVSVQAPRAPGGRRTVEGEYRVIDHGRRDDTQ